MNEAILAELQKQTALLRNIQKLLDPNATEQGQLGPSDMPEKTLWLFIGERDGGEYCWYSMSEEGKPVPFPYPLLTAFIKDVRLTLLTYENAKYRPKVKLDLCLEGDRKYVIRSTIETVFSRKVLLAIPHMKIHEPVLIGPKRRGESDEENVVFCNFMQDNLPRIEWEKDTDPYVLWAIAKLRLNKTKDEYEELKTLKEDDPIILETFAKLYLVETPQDLSELKSLVGKSVSERAWNMLPKSRREQIKNEVLNPQREI